MKTKQETGKGKGKKGKKTPLPTPLIAFPLFPFAAFLLPLIIPIPVANKPQHK
jgi:hypothetical protein